jgi:exodeoxyribonuclease X
MKAIVFDCETTGLVDPDLVQTAWVQVDHMGDLAHPICSQLWKPEKPISYGAMATHHILDADVADKPPAADFRLPDGVTHLIGHNIDFDWRVIGEPNIKRICTLALARRAWPDMDSHALGALIYRTMDQESARLALRGAHDAAADVGLCAYVLRVICQARRPVDLDDLWRMSEDARVPTHMPFGKHKGMPIASVPDDYKAWLKRQPDIDPYLMQAINSL